MSDTAGGVALPWYRTSDRQQWRVPHASSLGWLIGGFKIGTTFVIFRFVLRNLRNAVPGRGTLLQACRISRINGPIGAVSLMPSGH